MGLFAHQEDGTRRGGKVNAPQATIDRSGLESFRQMAHTHHGTIVPFGPQGQGSFEQA
jgi:hypothetical protein